ncbi:MAG: GH3 auxin-responsive promoter family protein [Synechococcales bacterium]|nr:GH3 auxin-responsive promoter family protein [Synechococcales bacterium]
MKYPPSHYWQRFQRATQAERDRFQSALAQPELTQQQILQAILQANQETVVGQAYGFSTIPDYHTFRQRVPIHTYDDLLPWIRRTAAGEPKVLTAEPAIAFELTGGSTQGAKLIPYTQSGIQSFQRGIFTWLGDLITHRPAIQQGRTYWAISPATRQPTTTLGGIPIGLASDAAYFGDEVGAWIGELLAVPAHLGAIAQVDHWRYQTVLHLLAAADLSFISVWSPTFLLQFVEEIQKSGDRLLHDLYHGTPTLPAQPVRAAAVKAALTHHSLNLSHLWPQLDTLSCWTSAAAHAFLPQIQSHCPSLWIQGKGLLATEGVVTLPQVGCLAPVLAIRSGFYEFLDAAETPHLCHQLQMGQDYRVVITTPSGLYRYDLGDRVRLVGWHQQTPLLEFVGRAGVTSDLCGEKLTEAFVLQQFRALQPQYALGAFMLLVPALQEHPHYVLVVDGQDCDGAIAPMLLPHLDQRLSTNPQYAYARRMGQLRPPRLFRAQAPTTAYVQARLQQGQRLGDIKPPVLTPYWQDLALFQPYR